MGTKSENLLYIFQLPAKITSELSAALDPGNGWESIAFLMPDIQDVDIEVCRRLSNAAADGHPTETLLRIWGSKGYMILDLYKVFFRAKLLRCMQILLPYVDRQFHKYAQSSIDDEPHQSSQFRQYQLAKSPDLKQSSHQPLIKKNSYAEPGVYSRKGFSSTEPSAGSEHVLPATNSPSTISGERKGGLVNGLQNTLPVKYEDILTATGDFNSQNILGRGGYGVVYKGIWKHTEVAIKRIQGKREDGGDERQQKERIRQSLQELQTLAKYRHDNILSLYGYSLDGNEPCLIYQFMSNGSLEDRLLCKNGTDPLSWPTKLSICKGVSCGLHFLHTIGAMPIIHGDVKSANILLDKYFEPKLGDFGLSRDGQIELEVREKKPMIASHVKGTLAYLPPEFTSSRILTTKLDVYSYGIVLLEVGSGQRAFISSRDPQGLVEYTLKYYSEDRNNSEITAHELLADKRTPNLKENQHIFQQLISLGIACTRKDRFSRPTFSQIFSQLNQSMNFE